jgi:hypothetical protein
VVFLFLWFSQLYLPVREILKVKERKRGKMRREKKDMSFVVFCFFVYLMSFVGLESGWARSECSPH